MRRSLDSAGSPADPTGLLGINNWHVLYDEARTLSSHDYKLGTGVLDRVSLRDWIALFMAGLLNIESRNYIRKSLIVLEEFTDFNNWVVGQTCTPGPGPAEPVVRSLWPANLK